MSKLDELLKFLDGYDFGEEWEDIARPICKQAAAELAALKARLAEAEEALELIADIAYDRDGYKSADKLGELIDELYGYARNPKSAHLVSHPEVK